MSVDVIEELKKFAKGWEHIESASQALNAAIEHFQNLDANGYLGVVYRTDYIVEGYGEFPHDMLRYTSSYPMDEESSRAMSDSFNNDYQLGMGGVEHNPKRQIKLSRFHRDPKPSLAEDRWLSKFRWKVVSVIDTVPL